MKSSSYFAAGILVGLILGFFGTKLFFAAIANKWTYTDYTGTIIADVNILTALKRGAVDDVISDKENELSSEIYDFYLVYSNRALTIKDSREILERAARYRTAHPYKTGDAEKDRVVEKVLNDVQKGITP